VNFTNLVSIQSLERVQQKPKLCSLEIIGMPASIEWIDREELLTPGERRDREPRAVDARGWRAGPGPFGPSIIACLGSFN